MRLWVDDERVAPDGWLWAKTAEEAIRLLEENQVEKMSLDHDLGDVDSNPEKTGYTVLTYVESRVVWDPDYVAPAIRIHTANVSARKKMELGRDSIERLMSIKVGK